MIGEKLGHYFDRPLYPLARKISIHPNFITVLGFLVTAMAGFVLSRDLRLGGLLVIVGGFFDMLDGAVARINGRVTDFGAFLDSVLDRYSDAFLFLGLAWYLGSGGEYLGAVLSIGTLVGALLISYARARAEGLGKDCKVGIMERPERIVLLVLAALTGWVVPVLWVMLVLTHLTVIQRILHVRRAMKEA
jgi:phosphatidylglycerophosphate synthase